jgi:hypothetical protein
MRCFQSPMAVDNKQGLLLPFVIASTLELNPMRTQVSSSLTQPSWSMPLCLSPLSKKAVNNTLLIGPYPQFRSTFYLFTLICKPALNPSGSKPLLICLQRFAYRLQKSGQRFPYCPFLYPTKLIDALLTFQKSGQCLSYCPFNTLLVTHKCP